MIQMFRALVLVVIFQAATAFAEEPRIVAFSSGDLTLRGELFLPAGQGPFPLVLYNHGSAPKMASSQASAIIGPMFAKKGWAFFMPYRRGQGLSENQGNYILDEIRSAKWSLFGNSSKKMVNLLKTDHLNDQLAALAWLKQQDVVLKDRIVAMGNSFGGIEVILGMEHGSYCAGVVASGGAESWKQSPELQALLRSSVRKIEKPILFFQAENDYDLTPSKELYSQMIKAGKVAQIKIYPIYGKTPKDGHSFAYMGASIWFEDVYSFIDRYCP